MIEIPLLPAGSVRRAVLPNGLTVLVRRDDSAPVVAIVTYVKAGYFDESDDVVGIAHVLEHMYFKGTTQRGVGEISKETKAAGGYLNAGTIYDHTSYYTVLPASGLVRGLEIQADAYADSLVDDEELRKELEVIIQEAKRKSDSPGAVAVETLYELLHDRHRIRRWRIGREAGLRRLTRDDVVRFYRGNYRPGNTILSIVGDVDPDEVMRHVERLYATLADAPIARDRGPAETGRHGFRYRELEGDIAQAQLAMGWRTPGSLHPDTPALDLAATVLGSGRASRLYRAVRERKLAASISAFNSVPTELGVFGVHADGPPETIVDAARGAWEQLRDLRDAGVGRDELWRARRIFEARWIRRLETAEGQANYLAAWEAEGDWSLGDRYLERLLTATEAQVTDVVREYLDPDQAGVVIYRPRESSEIARDAGAFRALLARERPARLPVTPPRTPSPAPAIARAPSLERREGRVHVYRTAAGVPLLVRRKGGAPLVHFGVYAVGGASEEDTRLAGLTHLMSRAAVKGTARRTAEQIAEDAELLGGSVGPHTGSELFGWSITVPTAHADAALELLADVVQEPVFPDEAVETERTVALADVRMLRDDMFRYPVRLATQAAFAEHPYGVPAGGSEETLPRITPDALRVWHRTRVLEGPVVLAVVGDVEPDDVASAVARYFPALRPGEPRPLAVPPWPAAPVTVAERRDKAQTAIALAFPGPSRGDEDRFAAHIIAGVASGLGGRFFDELRDRQSLAYTVHAFAAERRLAGMFLSYIATSPEKEEVARAGLLREFAHLRETPVSAEELARAQEYAIGTYAIHQGSGAAVLGDLVDAWLLGRDLRELEDHDARVRAVTPERMRDVAERYFDESRLVQGIVRGEGRVV
jgi:zinc protease